MSALRKWICLVVRAEDELGGAVAEFVNQGLAGPPGARPTFGWFPTGDSPVMARSGYLHIRSGAVVLIGPVPKNVRVGFPLNMVSPSTVPHARNSDSAVTTPVGCGGSVVVVLEVVAVVPGVPSVSVGPMRSRREGGDGRFLSPCRHDVLATGHTRSGEQ